MRKLLSYLFITCILTSVVGCETTPAQPGTKSQSSPKKLTVLYAGSLTQVMEQKIRPDATRVLGLEYQGEGKGSDALAQMIKSGLVRPDVFISASPGVNNRLLMGETNHNLVKWYFTLAQDQLVIAYSPKSGFKRQLDAAAEGQLPWYQVLESKGFRLGRTDPVLDPKGMNTIFLFELASNYYHEPNLKQQILGSDENPAQVFPEESLVAELTSGQVDAIIAYKHEAVEWGMPYISLPDAINLGDSHLAKTYAKATFMEQDGKIVKGAPIVFTITIPTTTSNPQGAQAFVKYMVSGPGHDILIRNGFTAIQTSVAGNESDVPTSLKGLIQGNSK